MNALRGRSRQAPDDGGRATNYHGGCTECERLQNVRPAANPAVDVNLGPSPDSIGDLRERIGRGHRHVQLPTAVIGYRHGVGAGVYTRGGIVPAQHSFDDHREVHLLS
jgi:hypothetical protein